MNRLILGIETSCDDTSVALVRTQGSSRELLGMVSQSSEKILAKWGGVVPELAAREHVKLLGPLIKALMSETGQTLEVVDEIAVTASPGLIGALLTGLHAAKTMALLHELPITPVPHLWAHLEAIQFSAPTSYPYIGLLVSGGHSLIVRVNQKEVEVLGQTLDDAAGEAFDKGGKMLGLGYPAGRIIDEKAKGANATRYPFPISRLKDRPGKMSFSGLKTALRVFIEKNPDAKVEDVCASYQAAIVETLVMKTKEVYQLHGLEKFPLVVGGGVAANSRLRLELEKNFKNVRFVEPRFCTDNAAMIAMWAAINPDASVPFPECLQLDAQSRLVEKPKAHA